jgi:hypothetical protein
MEDVFGFAIVCVVAADSMDSGRELRLINASARREYFEAALSKSDCYASADTAGGSGNERYFWHFGQK